MHDFYDMFAICERVSERNKKFIGGENVNFECEYHWLVLIEFLPLSQQKSGSDSPISKIL
jgi:hypothetical protein